MSHYPINTSDVPIRLFKSDFLEFFTHISPVAVLILWTPIIVLSMGYEIVNGQGKYPDRWYLFVGLVSGIFLWTLGEYLMHRFVFHYVPRNAVQERIFFLFHGVHHAQPQCKTRLVMPPVVSVPMAAMTYGIVYLLFAVVFQIPNWIGPLMSGFLTGYLCYDMIHYATHHFAMRSGIWKYLKRYHMQHHYKTPDARYGVSSPLWDVIFKTKPV
jgi:sterol desaturase/sphingolipid hydroxylase (fatty acid hydroxylase superfamily)